MLEDGFYYHLMERGSLAEADLQPDIVGLEFYVEAFREIGSCRPVGMGLGPIPFTAILEYFKIYPVGTVQEFWQIIRSMDDTYLRLEAEKDKASRKKNK